MQIELIKQADGVTIRYLEQGKEDFSITESYSNSDKSARMELKGELRSELQDEFADEMLLFLMNGMDLALDMAQVSYIASSCQKEIVTVNGKKRESGVRGKLTIVNVPGEIYRELEKIHLTKTVRIMKQGGKE